MRSPIAEQGRRTRQKWVLALLITAVTLGFVGMVAWKTLSQPDAPDSLLCPARTGPKGHVILLVDRTDPLSFTQSRAVNQLVEDIAKGRYAREGELLSVFVLGEDFRSTPDPIFERCNPGDGSSRSKLTENPELWKQKHEAEFVKPLMALEPQMRATQAGQWSPIFEMLQVVSLRFAKYDVRGRKYLILVSDMLHNTPAYSLYKEPPEFAVLQTRPDFAKLRSKLEAVDVELLLLMHTPQLQTRRLSRFWEDYFRDMGGRLQRIDPLPG